MEDIKERSFTIEETASILRCSRWAVQRMLANGWLRRPDGRPKGGESGEVSGKSLFQLMIIDSVNCLPKRTLKALKKGRKVFSTIWVQKPNANCLSIDEGRGQAPETSPKTTPQETIKPRTQCLHYDTAVQRQFSFGWLARQLAPGDAALQDDLVQEMSLAILEYDQPASPEFLFELAGNHAKNYLEYEARRGMLPLSEAQGVTDKMAEKMTNLSNLIDELLLRGVPGEWIEEVLGQKLDVA